LPPTVCVCAVAFLSYKVKTIFESHSAYMLLAAVPLF